MTQDNSSSAARNAWLEPLDSLLLGRLSPQNLDCGIPEEDMSQAELSVLHNYYFDYVYFSFPFVNKDRFAAESSSDGGSAARALVYAVAVAGCTHSPKDFDKQILCYNLARDFAEKCERDGNLDDLNFLQALVLIGRFEAMNQRLESSWLTLGRAAMVCMLLNLAQMDHSNGRSGIRQNGHQRTSRLALQDTDDPILLEERRRTFWALYILQSYVKTRTGWPCQLGDVKVGQKPSTLSADGSANVRTQDFRIALPMPGLLRYNLTPLKMPLIPNAYEDPGIEISSYAGCVLMVELALRCFDHRQAGSAAGFWDGYCALVKTTDDLFGILKPHLNAISVRTDPVAFSLYLNLRAAEIFLHELAMVQSDEQGLPPLMTAESQRRATTAAFQISSAVRLNLPSPGQGDSDIIMLQAIFIAWPLTMALKAFHRELAVGGDRETVNGVVASSRLLLAALDHIEETGGHWHQSVEHVGSKVQEWDEKTGFDSLAL
ncbi:hypothetical protein CcaCcLH18_02791 [Colletotrichum camelliae]|nr:hypothetical protein CcaCcLH18_02791 [Colletotrichum camelliae]